MTEEAFLRAILVTPEDDTPRLNYAGWLEDRGDPRAELIRTQCRLDRLAPFDPRRCPLNAREGELLQAHRDIWLAPMKGLSLVGTVNPFRRGILENIVVTVPELPLVEELMKGPLRTVRSVSVVVKEVEEPPDISPFSRVTEWTFITDGFAEDELLEELLTRCCAADVRSLRWTVKSESPYCDGKGEALLRGMRSLGDLPHLVLLELSGQSYFSGVAMESLVQSPWRSQLQVLDLSFSGWHAEELVPLLVKTEWPSLKRIDIFGWHLNLGESGQRLLLQAPLLKQLHHLGWSVEREPAMRTLGRLEAHGPFPVLERLAIGGLRGDTWTSRVYENGHKSSSSFPALRSLDFGDQWIGDEDLRILTNQPWLSDLRHLCMSRQADQQLSELGGFFKHADLQSLTALEICFFHHRTVLQELEESKLLSQLHYLNLMGCVDSGSLGLLTDNPQSEQLRFLGLGHNDLSVDDVQRVLNSPHLANLVYLDVSFCEWEIGGYGALENLKAVENALFSSAPPALAALQYVNLRGVERLRTRFFVDDWYREFGFNL